jgi:hypothetical protein
MPIADYLTPASLVKAARSAHPAFKYATAAAGIAGIVVILTKYGTSYATLVFGSILVLVVMVMFLVFSQAAALAKVHLTLPATVLVWAFLILGVLTASLLFTSAFVDAPLPFRSFIIRQLEPSRTAGVAETPPSPVAAASAATVAQPAPASAPTGPPKLVAKPKSEPPAATVQSQTVEVRAERGKRRIEFTMHMAWGGATKEAVPNVKLPKLLKCSPPMEQLSERLLLVVLACEGWVSASGHDYVSVFAELGNVHVTARYRVADGPVFTSYYGWLDKGQERKLRIAWDLQ